MKAKEIIHKPKLPKRQWVIDISHSAKHELSNDLIDLVQTAYASTHQAGFVQSLRGNWISNYRALTYTFS